MKPNKTIIEWLLEKDNPTIRYLTLKNIINPGGDNSELVNARKKAVSLGMIAQILDQIYPDGYWIKQGAGYSPKYRGTVWSLITLSQIGAKIEDDPRIKKACRYYLDHAFSKGGYLGYNGTPSGIIDCLQGNMCAALTDLGCKDLRLGEAFELMAQYVTGEGIAPAGDKHSLRKYYAYKCGPSFACGANGQIPCAWGAVKVMLALSKLPKSKRTKLIEHAISKGVEFLLNYDPVLANYPTRNNTAPNRSWWKFGFPVFYVTDILQNIEVLVNFGLSDHPKVKKAIEYVLSKQNQDGTWNLDYNYNNKTWSYWGEPRKPSKWVTYRVFNILRNVKY